MPTFTDHTIPVEAQTLDRLIALTGRKPDVLEATGYL